jgi:hypothetical protein
VTAEIKGLKQFERELRQADADLPKSMKAAAKETADHVTGKARTNARSAGDVWAKAAPAITSRATATSASVGVSQTSRAPMALPAFWGAKARTGWFGNPLKYGEYSSQHPEWVGANWEAASRSEGPYVINYTLLEELDEAVEIFGQAVDDLSARAFPI